MRLPNTNDGLFYVPPQEKTGEGFSRRLKTIAAKGEKNIQPLPFAVYFWTVAALAVAGLVNAVYLSITHYRVYTYPAYESFCAISEAVNCDTVSQDCTRLLASGSSLGCGRVSIFSAITAFCLPSRGPKQTDLAHPFHHCVWPTAFTALSWQRFPLLSLTATVSFAWSVFRLPLHCCSIPG